MRKLRIALLVVVVALVGLSAVQYLWILFSPYDKGQLYNVYKEIWRDQKPVNITIHAVDQFGEPVPKFKVLVTMRSVSWYFKIFPLWAQHFVNYELETDQRGTGKLSLWLRRAYGMQFKEVDESEYIFPVGNRSSIGNLKFDPKIGFMLNRMDGAAQVIEMQLLRHGPPVKLERYNPEIPGRGQIGKGSCGVEVEAQDEMVFTVDVMGNKFLEGRQTGDIVITVKNAKKGCDMFTKIYTPGLDFKEEGEWDVSLEALNGTMIQRAESQQYVTYAPETGYKKLLFYRMQIGTKKVKPEAANFRDPNGALWQIIRSASEEDEYASVQFLELFGGTLFFRRDNPRCYGVLAIRFDLMYRQGKICLKARGAYNPDGSTNLWTGSQHFPWDY